MFFFIVNFVHAQHPIWTTGNARVVPPRYTEISLTELSKYGLPYKMELQAQLPTLIAVPNIGVKKLWFADKGNYYFASRHSVFYPNIAFKILQKTGYKSLIDADLNLPFILSFTNELMFSKWLIPATSCEAQNYLLTARLGIKKAYVGSGDVVPLFEYPFVFPETQVFQKKPVWYVGVDLDASLNEKMNFCIDVDFFSINWLLEDFAIQHKGMLYIPLTNRMTAIAGYTMSYGTYPIRGNTFKVYPLIDLIFTFKNKAKDDKQLFDKNMRMDFDRF